MTKQAEMRAEELRASPSFWSRESERFAQAEPLPRDADVDVCVVGAGMAGISVAYRLLCAGRSVRVIADGPVGGGETERTSAHLASALDDRFVHLERWHGVEGSQMAAQSHAAAIDAIEEDVRALRIDCDFRRVDGYLFGADEQSQHELGRELEAARRAGLDASPSSDLPFTEREAIRFARQAELQPVAYVRALANEIVGRGGHIHTNVHVSAIEGGREPAVKLHGGGLIRARAIVDATNGAISSRLRMPLREGAYRSYMIALRIPNDSVPHALYWDTAMPYHYVRVARDSRGDVLLVGGEDHHTGQDPSPSRPWWELEQWTREHFPMARERLGHWSGQILEPVDGLAFIGASPDGENVFVVTGDSGHGLTHGAIAGILLAELIAGRQHGWSRLYSPSRPMRALGTWAREAMHSGAAYTKWATLGNERVEDLAPEEGIVLRRGLKPLAIYRDASGVCRTRSAICPHLGGIVQWNRAERTWDCPCHGSRFDTDGRVINGPATSDLAEVEQEAQPGEAIA